MLKNTDKKKISKNDSCTFYQEKKKKKRVLLKKKKNVNPENSRVTSLKN